MSASTKQGTGDGKAAAEKSKFAETCNRLSLFLKEKGNLRDISSEINAKFAAADAPKGVSELNPATTTVDFLSNMNMFGEEEKNNVPEYVILDSSDSIATSSAGATLQHINSRSNSNSKTTTGGQMSIFYKGKVMVVDDVPEDRARYVMLVAKNAGVPHPLPHDNNKSSVDELLLMAAASPSKYSQQQQQKKKDGDDVVLEEMINKSSSSAAAAAAADSDLPIARRASLNKFLAKRKDRATVRAANNYAPYHHQMSPSAAPGASSSSSERSFDLNM
uniref:protein TIFY 10B-like n=1 Tax=Erigeron canadensis TaxID=72917 RepID=UPI001CB96F99|nr:protein TIFY 10B-like [Erigeron canadensis]